MSTSSGVTSKGEKGKQKFQSLDIFRLIRNSRGETSEKQPQKTTHQLKHGMQSLGKVPNARRPPANLPSLKSEHSGNDSAVSLVPSGGPGWVKQDSGAVSTTTPSTGTTSSTTADTNNTGGPPNTTTSNSNNVSQISAHQAAIALPVTTTIPPPGKHPTNATPASADKSWSSVMSGNDIGHPPPYQMYRGNYPPNGHGAPGIPPNMPPQPSSGNSANNGRGSRTDQNRPAGNNSRSNEIEDLGHRPIIKEEDLNRMDDLSRDMGWAIHDDIDYNQKLAFSDDESPSDRERKKEKLKDAEKTEQLQQHPMVHQENDLKSWNSARVGSQGQLSRRSNEEEELNARRKQQKEQLHVAMERAKQRKEEEEKKYLESRQNAAKKLQELEERKNKSKREDIDESTGTINPSSVPPQPITPAPIPVPEWQKDKDRSRGPGDYMEEKPGGQKQEHRDNYDFKQLTQIEVKNFVRKENHGFDRERNTREQNGPSFSKQYQSNLPPRFQRQLRNNNTSSSPQPPSFGHDTRWTQGGQGAKNSPPQSNRKSRDGDSLDDERRDFRRQGSDDSYRGRSWYPDSGRMSADNRYKDDEDYGRDYDFKRDRDEEKTDKEKHDKKQDLYESSRQNDDLYDRRLKYDKLGDRYERPQRPDSRDSRTSRESRHSRDSARDSEPRDYVGSWADSSCDPVYEEKKKDHFKEDRRQVPGPITKDRIEAEDKNEKRNLTQLKRGQMPEKKIEIKEDDKSGEKDDDPWSIRKKDEGSKLWADSVPQMDGDNKYSYSDSSKNEQKNEDDQKKDGGKDDKNKHGSRSKDARMQGWGGSGSSFSGRSWSWKKGGSGRSSRPGGSTRPSSGKSGENHGTDSEISGDEMSISTESSKDERNLRSGSQRSPKLPKKDKDEKNKEARQEKLDSKQESKESNKKENYIARGEPSRRGRGGSSFHGGRGGLSKRIDGYGPPPSKSPFSHHEDKEKKSGEDVPDVTSSDEKSKQSRKDQNQGPGSRKNEDKFDRSKPRRGPDSRRGKSKNKDENGGDSASDNSEDSKDGKSKKSMKQSSNRSAPNLSSNALRRNNPPPRLTNEKRNYGPSRNEPQNVRQNSSGSLRSNQMKKEGKDEKNEINYLSNAIADISLKNKENDQEIETLDGEVEEKNSLHGDSDGFQEVKSKKNVKERIKGDEKPISKPSSKSDKENSKDRKGKGSNTAQLSQQQIANIPSLMATPVQPPPIMAQTSSKGQFASTRMMQKLPPRFAKQRESNRIQKQQLQQNICEISDMNKVNQSMYGIKDGQNSVLVALTTNAWEKPLSVQLRGNLEQDNMLGIGMDACKAIDQAQSPNTGQTSPGADKMMGKGNTLQEKAVLDGATPPVETIIFENTNFKSAPGSRVQRPDKPRSKMEDGNSLENSVISSFNKPITDLLNKNDKQSDMRMQLNFNKEDGADIKLDFIESDIYLSDDKSSKTLSLPRSIHITSGNSNADALNYKIASVKKVWDSDSTIPTVLEHSVGQDDSSSFPTSFATDPNSLDPSGVFTKGADAPDDNNEGYSPSPSQTASNTTTNVCKVKPTQQITVSSGQTVLNAGNHQTHSAMVGPGLMGHPLSPPPMQPVIGASVGLGQAPQQYTASQHAIGYQTGLGGNTQYGMPAIPSPPTVLFNSSQQLQAQTAGLYAPFMDQTQVLGSQGRSQYSQYANHYGLGQTASSPYSQSMYLQTAQPHPPPTAQAPPDLYQGMSSYRLPANAPFGQSQQLNNQSTVLISSTSNSLMSATVKPSSQQISAIGTKAGGVGQAYQQQSQTGQQLYMTYDPTMHSANYLQNTGVIQRGPGGPVQNNAVPTLQPHSSYYSGSTGAQTGYFQQPNSSTLQSGPLGQHQTGYGLQGNVFGTHNQSSAGLQNFGSHFLSAPMQLAAAAITQQYRSTNHPNTAYMKTVGNQQISDQSGRSQQLKSPGSQQEVLSSVFNSGPQIPSPKSRQSCKQPPPQPSPTAQHKYNMYQTMGSQQTGQGRSYLGPIQRPVNFQNSLSSVQNNGNNPKHRSNNSNTNSNRSGAPSRQYYSTQTSSLVSQTDKVEDNKLSDSVTPNTTNATIPSTASSVAKTSIGGATITTPVSAVTSEISKDKEDVSAIKD